MNHEEKQSFSSTNNVITDQIEILIQQQNQISVPALILEYPSDVLDDNFEWEHEDMNEICSYFGEIETIEINGKKAFVLFKNFFDAYSCKEYLLNTNNFKVIKNSNCIKIKWFDLVEDQNIVSSGIQEKIKRICLGGIAEQNINCNNINNNNDCEQNNKKVNSNWSFNNSNAFYNNPNHFNNCGNQVFNNFNYYFPVVPQEQYDFNNYYNNYFNNRMNNNPNNNYHNNNFDNSYTTPNQQYYNNYSGSNTNYTYQSPIIYNEMNDEKLSSYQDKQYNSKYTCRFEIQIENDKDFQVARRLIGIKGCNMKRIIEKCNGSPKGGKDKYSNNQETVKLRLRGRGSGYKEGPNNRESDEPLHLCVSAKFYDKYKKACILVQELIINIYDEYKRFCEKNNRSPVSDLTVKKFEGVFNSKDNLIDEYEN
jgi:hypothetical protein